jgi:hypothetical protein
MVSAGTTDDYSAAEANALNLLGIGNVRLDYYWGSEFRRRYDLRQPNQTDLENAVKDLFDAYKKRYDLDKHFKPR